MSRKPASKPKGMHSTDKAMLWGFSACVFGMIVMAASTKAPEQTPSAADKAAVIRMRHEVEEERFEPTPQAMESLVARANADLEAHRIRKKPARDPARSMAYSAGDAEGIERSLVHGVMLTESDGCRNARPSSSGAIGCMQLMPATAKGLGCDPHNPRENVRCGALYLKKMIARYDGKRTLGLIAYNWGPGNTDLWLKRGGHWSKLPRETRDYLSKVSLNADLSDGVTLAWGGK